MNRQAFVERDDTVQDNGRPAVQAWREVNGVAGVGRADGFAQGTIGRIARTVVGVGGFVDGERFRGGHSKQANDRLHGVHRNGAVSRSDAGSAPAHEGGTGVGRGGEGHGGSHWVGFRAVRPAGDAGAVHRTAARAGLAHGQVSGGSDEAGVDRAIRCNRTGGVGITRQRAAASGHRLNGVVGVGRDGESRGRAVIDGLRYVGVDRPAPARNRGDDVGVGDGVDLAGEGEVSDGGGDAGGVDHIQAKGAVAGTGAGGDGPGSVGAGPGGFANVGNCRAGDAVGDESEVARRQAGDGSAEGDGPRHTGSGGGAGICQNDTTNGGPRLQICRQPRHESAAVVAVAALRAAGRARKVGTLGITTEINIASRGMNRQTKTILAPATTEIGYLQESLEIGAQPCRKTILSTA